MSPRILTHLAVMLVCAMVVGLWSEPAEAKARGSDYKRWINKGDNGEKTDVHAEAVERYSEALKAVEKEEAAADKALAKAEADAAKKAGGDAPQAERLRTTACRKAIAALEACRAKYGRIQAAAQPIAKKPGLSEQSKTQLQVLAVKLNMARRRNVERIADLYEKIGKDRTALALLEMLYRSIPEQQRFTVLSLKNRIDALKERLSPRRKGAGTR